MKNHSEIKKALVKCPDCHSLVREDRLARHKKRVHITDRAIPPILKHYPIPRYQPFSRSTILRSSPNKLTEILAARLQIRMTDAEFSVAADKIKKRTLNLTRWLPWLPERIVWDTIEKCHIKDNHQSVEITFHSDSSWVCHDPSTGKSISSDLLPTPTPPKPLKKKQTPPPRITAYQSPASLRSQPKPGTPQAPSLAGTKQSPNNRANISRTTAENDGSEGYYKLRDINGQFGSHPSHDDHGEWD